jgi:hypothetical protein
VKKSIACIGLICVGLMLCIGQAWAEDDAGAQNSESQSADTPQAVAPDTSDTDSQAAPQQSTDDGANASSEEPGLDANGPVPDPNAEVQSNPQ